MLTGKNQAAARSSTTIGRSVCRAGLGVVAGGMMFVGQADAGVLVSESFEASPSSMFGAFSSYAYAENYTSANTPPSPGLRYFTGAPGQASQTHASTVSLTDLPNGVSAALIDGGLANFNVSAYFSSYTTQNDYSAVRVQFVDGSATPLGDVIEIGGADFVAALGFGPNGAGAAGFRDFGLDAESGLIPAGARSAEITIFTQRLAGNAADGYLDLLTFEVGQVPEPGAAAIGMLGAALVGLRRRRRQ